MYSGFLIKVGDYEIPLSYMYASSYKAAYETLDLDSYRDSNGVLQRTALEHKVPTVEIQIKSLDNEEMGALFKGISDNYINATEKKVLGTVWMPQLNDYVTDYMYIPTVDITIHTVDEKKVHYDPFTLKLIGY